MSLQSHQEGVVKGKGVSNGTYEMVGWVGMGKNGCGCGNVIGRYHLIQQQIIIQPSKCLIQQC